MRRGELYRVQNPSRREPKRSRVFVVVSRQVLIDSRFSTVICAPVYSSYDGLSTQVPVGVEEGLKHHSSIHCDELISLPKSMLSDFAGSVAPHRIQELDVALMVSLDIGADLY
jgi:mRNA interferase MazF